MKAAEVQVSFTKRGSFTNHSLCSDSTCSTLSDTTWLALCHSRFQDRDEDWSVNNVFRFSLIERERHQTSLESGKTQYVLNICIQYSRLDIQLLLFFFIFIFNIIYIFIYLCIYTIMYIIYITYMYCPFIKVDMLSNILFQKNS